MSKLLPIILLLTSCDLVSDSWYGSKAMGHELYYHPDFYQVENISGYMWDKVIYKADVGTDVWTGPRDTFMRRYGDCEDISMLYLNILYVSKGIKGSIALVDVPGRAIVNGGNINHAIVEVDGVQIEPQTGMVVNYKIGYRYAFDEIFL